MRRDLVRARTDANATPWPVDHHAYAYSCTERLGEESARRPRVRLPETHPQHQEARRAAVFPDMDTREDLFLIWSERYGVLRRVHAVRGARAPGPHVLPSSSTG